MPRLSFRQIFESEYDYVWRSLRRLGAPERDIEDLAHEAFLRIHKNLGTYDSTRPLKPWIFAFVFRVASEHRRLRRTLYEEPSGEIERGSPTAASDAESRDLVRRGLEALTETTRAVFILHELDGFTVKEIAEVLGVPLNTAYSRLRLAREAFVARVRELGHERGIE